MESLAVKIALAVLIVVIWLAIMTDFWLKYEAHKAWREAVKRENEEQNKKEQWKRRGDHGIQ